MSCGVAFFVYRVYTLPLTRSFEIGYPHGTRLVSPIAAVCSFVCERRRPITIDVAFFVIYLFLQCCARDNGSGIHIRE